jgi:predicted nucleotidyltransferase component of viral defense system
MVLLNPYGVEMGTSGLILQAQSREELFADKLVAFALRPNRLKNRDLWDIAWLHQQQVKPALDLIGAKLHDHQAKRQAYLDAFSERAASLTNNPEIAKEFRKEMSRFLPHHIVNGTVLSESFWQYLGHLLTDYRQQLHQTLAGATSPAQFRM